jgi:integrase/recombinase XerD
MKLHEVTTQYVAYKQSMGMRFRTEARVLKSFCRMIGDEKTARRDLCGGG